MKGVLGGLGFPGSVNDLRYKPALLKRLTVRDMSNAGTLTSWISLLTDSDPWSAAPGQKFADKLNASGSVWG